MRLWNLSTRHEIWSLAHLWHGWPGTVLDRQRTYRGKKKRDTLVSLKISLAGLRTGIDRKAALLGIAARQRALGGISTRDTDNDTPWSCDS